MAEFSVKTNTVREAADAQEKLLRELDDIQQSVRKISGSLGIKAAATASIKTRLGSLAGRIEDQKAGMMSMKDALDRVASLYEETERNICGYAEGEIKASKSQTAETGSSFWSYLENLIGKIVEGLFSAITAIWSNLVSFIEGMIGKGDVTDSQPSVTWNTEVVSGIVAAIQGASDTTVVGNATTGGNTTVSGAQATVADSAMAGSTQTTTDLKEREGTIIADINGENYCSNKNMSYAGGFKGECTWYAYGRFMEVTGISLNSARHAKTWLDNNAGDNRVKITYGWENIQSPAIAVNESGAYGHVMFIEGVEYNADGTPAYVYLTEANNSAVKPDGILQKLTYDQFKGKGISGYITAA